MKSTIRHFFARHFEWAAMATALVLMALMNPYIDNGSSWCFFEMIGIPFCPGEGLGHSIAFTFRGDWSNALQANVAGPFAIIILVSRIGLLIKKNIISNKFEQPNQTA